MSIALPISFPSEAEQLQRLGEATQGMAPAERIRAVFSLSALADALSRAGGKWEAQLAAQTRAEDECRNCIQEFLAGQVRNQNDAR
jgi:hypothetical protein